MQKLIKTLLFCFALTPSFGQAKRAASLYLQGQYTHTLYDVTQGNNPWGMGLGLQVFFQPSSAFRPTLDFTADAYLEDDKVARLNADETVIGDVGSMVNLFAGLSYHPATRVYLSLAGGPGFISGETRWGIKPSVGYYFSSSQRWVGRLSYINVFNGEARTRENFGSISLSLGLRLF